MSPAPRPAVPALEISVPNSGLTGHTGGREPLSGPVPGQCLSRPLVPLPVTASPAPEPHAEAAASPPQEGPRAGSFSLPACLLSALAETLLDPTPTRFWNLLPDPSVLFSHTHLSKNLLSVQSVPPNARAGSSSPGAPLCVIGSSPLSPHPLPQDPTGGKCPEPPRRTFAPRDYRPEAAGPHCGHIQPCAPPCGEVPAWPVAMAVNEVPFPPPLRRAPWPFPQAASPLVAESHGRGSPARASLRVSKARGRSRLGCRTGVWCVSSLVPRPLPSV